MAIVTVLKIERIEVPMPVLLRSIKLTDLDTPKPARTGLAFCGTLTLGPRLVIPIVERDAARVTATSRPLI
jgi:hypothetical protein